MGITFESLQFGWFDVLVITVLLVGVSRGRKRGMSEELLDVIKWALVVFIAANIYEPAGQVLAQSTVFEKSLTGLLARTYLSSFLIRPTLPEEKQLTRSSVVRGRERLVEDVLDKR